MILFNSFFAPISLTSQNTDTARIYSYMLGTQAIAEQKCLITFQKNLPDFLSSLGWICSNDKYFQYELQNTGT